MSFFLSLPFLRFFLRVRFFSFFAEIGSRQSKQMLAANLNHFLSSDFFKTSSNTSEAKNRGGGIQVVSMLAFNSNDSSSNPIEVYNFKCQNCCRNKRK